MSRLSELAGASICKLRQHHHQRLHQSWLSRGGASAFQVRHLKQMEVILTERIKNVGEAGDIVKVAPGYARNYLCPQLKAMPAISKYIALVRQNLKFWPPRAIQTEADEAERKAKEEMEKQKEIDKMLRRLDTGKVVVYRIVLDKTNLRYFVSSKDLVPEVRKQMNIELTEAHIDLPTNISTLGEFEVPLRLPPNLPLPGGKERLFLKVRVRRKNRIHNTQTVPKKH